MAVKTQKTHTSVSARSAGSEFHAAIAGLVEHHELVRLMAGSMTFVTRARLAASGRWSSTPRGTRRGAPGLPDRA